MHVSFNYLQIITSQDYSSALHIYESLLKKDEINKSTLLCGMGRVHLQASCKIFIGTEK